MTTTNPTPETIDNESNNNDTNKSTSGDVGNMPINESEGTIQPDSDDSDQIDTDGSQQGSQQGEKRSEDDAEAQPS